MAGKKPKFLLHVSPVGTAAYAWVNKPDTKFKAEGEFKLTLLIPKGEQADAMIEAYTQKAIQGAKDNPETEGMVGFLKAQKKGGINLPWADGDEMADEAAEEGKDKEQFRGFMVFTYKTGFKPNSFDAKRQPLPENVFVMSGDSVRVSCVVKPYKTPTVTGIKLQMKGVQLITKAQRGGGCDFDEYEDGFNASEYEAPNKSNTDADDEDGEDDGDF